MASSLKAYVPVLARRLGTTPAALYERQRALVRDGFLAPSSKGRGPGSGVHLNPYPLAALLLAVLATDSLSDTVEKVRIFAEARSTAAQGCPLTGARNLIAAITSVLVSGQASNIRVGRTSGMCSINYMDKRRERVSNFVAQVSLIGNRDDTTRLQVEAMISGGLISVTSADVRRIAKLK